MFFADLDGVSVVYGNDAGPGQKSEFDYWLLINSEE